MSKRVALTQRVETIENIGERRDALSQEWAVLARGLRLCAADFAQPLRDCALYTG